ncbi:hypothetical protein [Paenibacillus sp. FSL W7-1287]|uniref:hypothetical protein n=1 Tax=Paenibacillus sp. FSL W7-1287 TaxID=2954538 RepID=UPI0030F5BF6F
MNIWRQLLCLILISSLLLGSEALVIAEPAASSTSPLATEDEELHDILQSSLSIVEIDKEIERIQARQLTLQEQILDTELKLYEGEDAIENKRKQAGKVLAAYYKGERIDIYLSILKSKSLEQFLYSLEMIEYILSQDRRLLDAYIEDYEALSSLYEQYAAENEQLIAMEQDLQNQRQRIVELEQQIDTQLNGRTDAERVTLLIEQLIQFWEQQGIVQVRAYFEALASAMNELPGWLQKNSQYFSYKGFNYTVTLPEDVLNQYLQDYDPMFEYFKFDFNEGSITAYGKRDEIEIEITGQYTVVDEPSNYIQFSMDELKFNGFALPDSTKQELAEQFDLNFYPNMLIKLLRAKNVEVKDDQLIIELKLAL